jgi:hypothetical protein
MHTLPSMPFLACSISFSSKLFLIIITRPCHEPVVYFRYSCLQHSWYIARHLQTSTVWAAVPYSLLVKCIIDADTLSYRSPILGDRLLVTIGSGPETCVGGGSDGLLLLSSKSCQARGSSSMPVPFFVMMCPHLVLLCRSRALADHLWPICHVECSQDNLLDGAHGMARPAIP